MSAARSLYVTQDRSHLLSMAWAVLIPEFSDNMRVSEGSDIRGESCDLASSVDFSIVIIDGDSG